MIAAHLSADPRLATVASELPGLRVPGSIDGFEMAVRAILGQRISVPGATTLAGRLAAACGEPIETPFPLLNLVSPGPERLALAEPGELVALGIAAPRARAIVELARAVVERRIELVPGADPDLTIARLLELPGIGDWTAHYIAMRALRWPDAFPAADLGRKVPSTFPWYRRVGGPIQSWRVGGPIQSLGTGEWVAPSNPQSATSEPVRRSCGRSLPSTQTG